MQPVRGWSRLGIKLFASYLAVIGVGIITLALAADAVAPVFYSSHMAQMRASGLMQRHMGGNAGPPATGGPAALEDELAASFRTALTEALLVASTAAVAAAVAVSLFVTARVVGPVRRLVAASRRIAAGHYAERVPPGGPDELGDLARSFNDMASALEATERRRLELLGDVAHELRTPIATLEGYLEGLLDGVVASSETTWAKLLDEAGRLRRLVDDLQELSRAEARQISLKLEAVRPAEIASAAAERLASQFAEKGLAFDREIPSDLPAVLADRDRAVQVLTNLLTNALRYTPAPGTVRLTLQPESGAVQFTVTDTGIGIAAADLSNIFERFYRVDKSRSRALGGSGIGLTIARALVEAMGGRIWAESPGLGQGATFRFTLPLAR